MGSLYSDDSLAAQAISMSSTVILDDRTIEDDAGNVSVLVPTLDSINIDTEIEASYRDGKIKNPKFPYEGPLPPLIDRYIDEPRPLRVAVIGGGIAGIVAGILLPKKVPGIILTIYDKNEDFVSLT